MSCWGRRGWDRHREHFWVGISKPCDRYKSCLPHTQGTACEMGGRLAPLLVPTHTAPLLAQVLGSHLLELLPSILRLPPGLPLLTPPAPGSLRMKHSESILLSLINLLWLPSPRTKPTLFSLVWPAHPPQVLTHHLDWTLMSLLRWGFPSQEACLLPYSLGRVLLLATSFLNFSLIPRSPHCLWLSHILPCALKVHTHCGLQALCPPSPPSCKLQRAGGPYVFSSEAPLTS